MQSGLTVEDIGGHPGYVRLAALDSVLHDLRYAGCDNFAGRNLYGALDCAWLRREAADGLNVAAAWLAERRSGCRILVLDALRPHRVQTAIWRDVVGTPMALYFADPAIGSIHSWGMAVDVTLVDRHGAETDMGSGYDEMNRVSHPALHAEHLASGALTETQVEERGWLADAMAEGGFSGIDTEWWHFDHGDRVRVRRELPRVE